MRETKRIFLLVVILVFISFSATGIAITMLYQTAIKQQKDLLLEIAKNQARLIEAETATPTQILETHAVYKGFGDTGEFTLAKLEGQSIVFLISHRQDDMEQLKSVPFDSELAEPSRRALSGLSGSMIGLDYRGKKVLAAYGPVAVLDLGIVAKIDLSDVRAPFIRAGLISTFFVFLAVALGALYFTLIINPAIEKLKKSEQWQQSIFEGSRDAVFISGADAKFVDVNEAAVILTGYSKKELKKMNVPDLYDEEDLGPYKTFFKRIMSGEAVTSQGKIRRKDSCKIDIEFSNSRIEVGGEPYMHTTARNITERSHSEAALRESEMKYRALFESANDAIFLLDLEGSHVAVNKKAADMLGYDMDELVNKSFKDIVAPIEYHKAQVKLQDLIAGKTFQLYERIFRKKDGTEFPVEINVALIRDSNNRPLYVQSIVRDITARKKVEKKIKSSLKEKEVLMKEIHHRVKNNMQIISSLLRLQAANIEDDDIQEMFQESQNRIRTMALVHDKLYKSKNFAKINFTQYIQSLILHLFQTYNIKSNTIKLKTDLDEVFLDINQAIPCGLLINEIVSNSLKHAFPKNKKGMIRVSLHTPKKGKISLQIFDNGTGFPEDLDFRNPTTLGLQLVNDLVKQLNGILELDGRKGTRISIVF